MTLPDVMHARAAKVLATAFSCREKGAFERLEADTATNPLPLHLIDGSLLGLFVGVAPKDQHAILRKRPLLLLRKRF